MWHKNTGEVAADLLNKFMLVYSLNVLGAKLAPKNIPYLFRAMIPIDK